MVLIGIQNSPAANGQFCVISSTPEVVAISNGNLMVIAETAEPIQQFRMDFFRIVAKQQSLYIRHQIALLNVRQLHADQPHIA